MRTRNGLGHSSTVRLRAARDGQGPEYLRLPVPDRAHLVTPRGQPADIQGEHLTGPPVTQGEDALASGRVDEFQGMMESRLKYAQDQGAPAGVSQGALYGQPA